MPFKDKDQANSRKRQLYLERRSQWIAENGPCQRCGSCDNLEVDHVDPALKEYQPNLIWRLGIERRTVELEKCQVLCRSCHERKSILERGRSLADHGSPSYYNNQKCRCQLCTKAWADYIFQRRNNVSHEV